MKRKCEPDNLIYTSHPPQSKCKHCGQMWFCKDNIPNCKILIAKINYRVEFKEPKYSGTLSDIEGI